MKTLLALLFLMGCFAVQAQPEKKSVVIGSMITKPNAILIVNPQQADQGVLLPQLSSSQRTNLKPSSPGEDGLIVFDTDLGSFFYWSQGAWVRLLNNATKQISFHNLDPASFSELKSGENARHSHAAVFESDNTFITLTRDGRGKVMAPIELPHGASMRELTLYYLDNDDDNLEIHLMRRKFTGESEIVLTWQSSGSSKTVTSKTFQDFNGMEAIDRENYTYRLIVGFDNDNEVRSAEDALQRLYGVMIKYEQSW